MEEIIKMMKEYAKRHTIKNGISIVLEDDYSGGGHKYPISIIDKQLFVFDSIDKLKQKLSE